MRYLLEGICARREVLCAGAAGLFSGCLNRPSWGAEIQLSDRVHGLLLGAAVGDAVGGPVEFQSPESVRDVLPDCRNWMADRVINSAEVEQLADQLPLLDYQRWRPNAEPYGQWSKNAPAGTVTDDTRHKMVLMAAWRTAVARGAARLTRQALAEQYASVAKMVEFDREEYAALREESFREFVSAADSVLGQATGLPPARIWGGLPTCCGQMILTPLAAIHQGDPVEAYQRAFDVAFFDQGTAKDTNAAIVAGLSIALTLDPATSVDSAFARVRSTMLETDPYDYHKVPFIQRPIRRWINHAEQSVVESAGRPDRLYEQLKQRLHPHYFWEARFTFGAAWALLKLCEWNGLAAMHLAMDMGHDTDSVAQLIGQLWGAVKGAAAFPRRLTQPVVERLQADYGVSIGEWSELLT